MGAGKTTIGKKLASRMGYQFIDTDKLIEQHQKLSIDELFKQFGEDHFRELEKQIVEQLKSVENVVVSTGGGMPCFNNLMDQLNEMGLTIYLRRPPKELAKRILNSWKKRPLTEGKSEDELIDFVTKKVNEREVFYMRANIIADRDSQTITPLEMLIKATMKQNGYEN